MRMDIFEGLTQDAKRKAVNEFMLIYGVDDVTEECSDNLYTAMKNFPCGLYEDGYICPSDDLNKLGDLLNEFLRTADKGSIESKANATIFQNAVENAMGVLDEYTQPDGNDAFKWLCFSMDCLGVMFDDVGNVVYVDK